MTTFELCCVIRHNLLTAASESIVYKSWTKEFALQNLREVIDRIKKWDEYHSIDPSLLTLEEMKQLGFCKWEDGNPMMLVPLWLYPFIYHYVDAEDINGGKHRDMTDMDNDHRGGYLAYGVVPKS